MAAYLQAVKRGYIICDTNVWFSEENLDKTEPQAHLCATLINLLELLRTPWNIDRTDVTRVACQQLIQRNNGICVYSPTKSIAIASGLGIDDGNETLVGECLDFIARIADGDVVDPAKRDAFRTMIEHQRRKSMDLADHLNALADSVRSYGIDKRDPTRGQDMAEIKKFIASLVGHSIAEEVSPEQINWDEVELLLFTMHSLLLEFELSKRRWQPNDINDLFNLAYVGKADLYWTLEKRWLKIIIAAGMGHYLFIPQPKC